MRTTATQVLALIWLLIFAPLVCAQKPASLDRDWNNLRSITHKRVYGFVRHDGTCSEGRITKVTDQAVTVRNLDGSSHTIARADLMRVEDGDHIYDVAYSGRSSWHDVKGMFYNQEEKLRVTTKGGKKHEGKFGGATDSEISLVSGTDKDRSTFTGKVTFAKADVQRVEYIRITPVTGDTEYALHEGVGWTRPEIWPWYLGIGKYLTVRIYEASLPEDNSPLPCRE